MKVIILNDKTEEKGRDMEEMNPIKVLNLIDFVNDLFKDFTVKVDEYAKENKIPPELILDVMKVIILNDKTEEKGRDMEEMNPIKVLNLIDFVNDLFKDFTVKVDEYAKENKIPPELILDVIEAVIDKEKGD